MQWTFIGKLHLHIQSEQIKLLSLLSQAFNPAQSSGRTVRYHVRSTHQRSLFVALEKSLSDTR